MHARLTLATLLAFTCAIAAQPKQPPKAEPKPERITYRVTGLFAPDREKDLRAAFEELPNFKLVAVNFADAEVGGVCGNQQHRNS